MRLGILDRLCGRLKSVRSDGLGSILGRSLCLSQVIFTFFPTPGPEPTLYGDPVKGSMLDRVHIREIQKVPSS